MLLVIATSLLALLALAKALVICHHRHGTELAFAFGHRRDACNCGCAAAADACACCGDAAPETPDPQPRAGRDCGCGCEPHGDDPVRLEPALPSLSSRVAADPDAALPPSVNRTCPERSTVMRPRFATGPPPPAIAARLRAHATTVLLL